MKDLDFGLMLLIVGFLIFVFGSAIAPNPADLQYSHVFEIIGMVITVIGFAVILLRK